MGGRNEEREKDGRMGQLTGRDSQRKARLLSSFAVSRIFQGAHFFQQNGVFDMSLCNDGREIKLENASSPARICFEIRCLVSSRPIQRAARQKAAPYHCQVSSCQRSCEAPQGKGRKPCCSRQQSEQSPANKAHMTSLHFCLL